MQLAVADKGESFEICFVPNGDYAAFMDAYLRQKGAPATQTTRRDRDHRRPHARRATKACIISPSASARDLASPPASRLYVISTDPQSQRVTVGRNDELLRESPGRPRRQLGLHRRTQRARPRAGKDPEPARRRARHAIPDRKSCARRSPFRPTPARRNPRPSRCLLFRGLSAGRRLDRVSSDRPHRD